MPSLSLEEMARRTFGFTSGLGENLSGNLSGIYHVRDTELSQGRERESFLKSKKLTSSVKRPIKLVQCMIKFLDNSNYTFEVDKNSKGGELLDAVFKHLEILEKDYFGLQYLETRSPSVNQKFLNNHLRHLKGFNNSYSSSNLSQSDSQETTWKWLDSGKSIKHQFKSDPPFKLYFRVRFFVSDPSKLQEENTRYHFFLQIRNDILDGKLVYSHHSLVKLSSYVVQSELGDYSPEEHKEGYLKDLELVPNQDLDIENEIAELHKNHHGQTPAEAEFNFLQHAKTLDTYGIEMHKAKNANNQNILIGVGSIGIVIFENGVKVNSFNWSKIIKLSFKHRYFYIQLRRENQIEKFETIVCFDLLSYRQCKRLWKSCVQHHTFFRLQFPKPQTKKLFLFLSLGSRFRYSGRTEFQALEESRQRLRPDKNTQNFSRTPSKRYARQTVPCLHSSSAQQVISQSSKKKRSDDLSATSSINNITDAANQTSTTDTPPSFWRRTGLPSKLLNGLSLSVIKHNMCSLTKLNSHNRQTSNNNGVVNGSKLVTSSSNNELKSSILRLNRLSGSSSNYKLNNGGVNSLNRKQLSSKSKQIIASELCASPGISVVDKAIDDDRFNSINKSSINHLNATPAVISNAILLSTIQKVGNSCLNKMQVKESSTRQAKEAWKNDVESSPTNEASPVVTVDCISTQNSRDDELSTSLTSNSSKSSLALNRNNLAFIDKFTDNTNEIIDAITNASFSENSKLNGKNLRLNLINDESPTNPSIMVKMKPSEDDMFGFNVKGGSDQNLPVIVTRVAPNTPAEGKLNEGDQVISVNGHEVEGISHSEVIKLIRSVEERTKEGELVLIIRPNIYNQNLGTDSELNGKEEPALLYNPIDSSLSKNKKKSGKLHQSIMLLYEGLESGSLVDQFERMYCEKPGEDMIIAKLPFNLLKNRYRDISPYDSTRVKIKNGTDEDYINASHVDMEIPGTGIVNRYIATQGPLSETTQDFWQMVYEQKSTLIVMVTPLIENDFIKCHKYWPNLNETLKLQDDMKLTCIKQNESNIMTERKFTLAKGGKKRTITHLLYKQWPDHGVPDDSTHFHQLINKVRRYRADMNGEPIIVHCSAGIGRTGVLILMETALCYIEHNLPVYPLELLKTMRDQRARLIQTPSQFTFVLQAIYDIYQKENQIKPEVEKR